MAYYILKEKMSVDTACRCEVVMERAALQHIEFADGGRLSPTYEIKNTFAAQ